MLQELKPELLSYISTHVKSIYVSDIGVGIGYIQESIVIFHDAKCEIGTLMEAEYFWEYLVPWFIYTAIVSDLYKQGFTSILFRFSKLKRQAFKESRRLASELALEYRNRETILEIPWEKIQDSVCIK